MKKPGIRIEILFTLIFLMVSALLLFGILSLRFAEQEILRERIERLITLNNMIAHSYGNGVLSLTQRHESDYAAILQEQGSLGWAFYDRQYNAVVSNDLSSFRSEISDILLRSRISGEVLSVVRYSSLLNVFINENNFLIVSSPIYSSGDVGGFFVSIYSFAEVRRTLVERFNIFLLYILSVSVVLILIGYYLIHKNLIKPLRGLFNATYLISSGNLSERIILDGPREILELTDSFNRMIDALEKTQKEKENHINSLEKLTQELSSARREVIVSEKMASVGQLASGLAHEIGNPLSALIGYLELLMKMEPGDSSLSHSELSSYALIEARRIDALVCGLLEYARPETNTEGGLVDVIEELRFCLDLLHRQGKLESMTVEDLLPSTAVMLGVTRGNLQQVFMNILLNAIDACDGSGTLEISFDRKDDYFCIYIKDDGCGISAEDLEKVFEPFFTTKAPGKGTGLGLAVCQRIVSSIGGRIDVESAAGEGCRFEICFPVQTVQKMH